MDRKWVCVTDWCFAEPQRVSVGYWALKIGPEISIRYLFPRSGPKGALQKRYRTLLSRSLLSRFGDRVRFQECFGDPLKWFGDFKVRGELIEHVTQMFFGDPRTG